MPPASWDTGGAPLWGSGLRQPLGLQAKLQNILKSWACPLPPGPRKCVEKGDGKHSLEREFAEQRNVKYLCANLSELEFSSVGLGLCSCFKIALSFL